VVRGEEEQAAEEMLGPPPPPTDDDFDGGGTSAPEMDEPYDDASDRGGEFSDSSSVLSMQSVPAMRMGGAHYAGDGELIGAVGVGTGDARGRAWRAGRGGGAGGGELAGDDDVEDEDEKESSKAEVDAFNETMRAMSAASTNPQKQEPPPATAAAATAAQIGAAATSSVMEAQAATTPAARRAARRAQRARLNQNEPAAGAAQQQQHEAGTPSVGVAQAGGKPQRVNRFSARARAEAEQPRRDRGTSIRLERARTQLRP